MPDFEQNPDLRWVIVFYDLPGTCSFIDLESIKHMQHSAKRMLSSVQFY
jgi:hypothetical protein